MFLERIFLHTVKKGQQLFVFPTLNVTFTHLFNVTVEFKHVRFKQAHHELRKIRPQTGSSLSISSTLQTTEMIKIITGLNSPGPETNVAL